MSSYGNTRVHTFRCKYRCVNKCWTYSTCILHWTSQPHLSADEGLCCWNILSNIDPAASQLRSYHSNDPGIPYVTISPFASINFVLICVSLKNCLTIPMPEQWFSMISCLMGRQRRCMEGVNLDWKIDLMPASMFGQRQIIPAITRQKQLKGWMFRPQNSSVLVNEDLSSWNVHLWNWFYCMIVWIICTCHVCGAAMSLYSISTACGIEEVSS